MTQSHHEKSEILCIMFSDLKHYSTLKGDRLKNKLVQEMIASLARISSPGVNHIKSIGDGLLVVSSTPLPLAETALKLRDVFKTTDWKSQGFPDDFLIRIGLHVDEVIVQYSDDATKIEDIIGTGVDAASRIEAVTDPNTVFCSARFYEILQGRLAGKIVGMTQGVQILAKDFGEMELYELRWKHETQTIQHASLGTSIPMPRIKKSFTTKDRNDYLRDAFVTIQKYFEKAVTQLAARIQEVDASLTEINDRKFVSEIYLNGELKARGKIWIHRTRYSSYDQIQFATGRFDIDNDNSYNDAITVEDDGFEMHLRTSFGMTFGNRGVDATKPSTPEQIAQYLWLRLTQSLEY